MNRIIIVGLLVLLGILSYLRVRAVESFAVTLRADDIQSMQEAMKINPASLPPPQEVFKHLRGLLDKYDRPDVWDTATQMMDKDPGWLARHQLGIKNNE
jgi:hypothetical protein